MHVFTSTQELVDHLVVLKTTVSAESAKFFELDHGLQCAALLKKSDPLDVELQVAGLIHDLAHPWDGPGQPRHATMGADAVRTILGERVSALIEGHVPAKRYLVTTRPEYRALLSEDSVMTLAAQGGDFTEAEINEFTAQPWWEAMVALRIADDDAKDPLAVVPPLEHWIDAIHSLSKV
jgi:predicted HD phosphohydrolase